MRLSTRPIAAALAAAFFLMHGAFLRPLAAQEPSPAGPSPGAAAAEASPGSAPAPVAPRQPRAKTEEEFAEYQRFMKEPSPDTQIQLIEDFLLHFPDSELREYAFQAATQAYQVKNDFALVRTYGELTLGENQDNLVALLILASSIPERTNKTDPESEENLAEAETYARHILNLLPRMPQPPGVTPPRWEQTRREAASTAHASLGMVHLIREDFLRAETEFKLSADLASAPDPVTFYRLGLTYSFQRKFDEALEALDRSDAVGGVRIGSPGEPSRDLVAEAKDFVLKSREAPATPGPGSQPPYPPATDAPPPQ
jgi:tetratricopeptide (TPR) repeat protein